MGTQVIYFRLYRYRMRDLFSEWNFCFRRCTRKDDVKVTMISPTPSAPMDGVVLLFSRKLLILVSKKFVFVTSSYRATLFRFYKLLKKGSICKDKVGQVKLVTDKFSNVEGCKALGRIVLWIICFDWKKQKRQCNSHGKLK